MATPMASGSCMGVPSPPNFADRSIRNPITRVAKSFWVPWVLASRAR